MTSDGGVFQIWIWPADCMDLSGSQAVEGTNVMPALDCFQSHFGRWQRHLSSSGENLAEVSNVHAGRGDRWLPLAGYNANETVNYSLACPVLFPA